MNQMTIDVPTPDLIAVKARQQSTWAAGDYAVVGTTLQIVGERLCERLDLAAGSRVLDVAAGNGNATLAAARRFCDVTSSDYVESLLERGRARAEAEGLAVDFRVADAEALPFADASFDAVLSTFGVMFTPDQMRAAAELARVCKPGGRIGLANWTPEGFIGQLFKVLGGHLPPPAGLASPARWGDPKALEELFGDRVRAIETRPRDFVFRYRSSAHFIDVFRRYYGPLHKAFIALGERGDDLAADIDALIARCNRADDGSVVVPSAYLEVCITV